MVSKINGTVHKENADTKMGIAFAQVKESNVMTIKYIREGGLFASTDLSAGLEVVTINGEKVSGLSVKEAADLLRNSPAGSDVSVVAKGILGQVEKESKDTKCGISLLRDAETNNMMVKSLAEDGLFSQTNIKVGQKIVSINGQECPKSTKDAIKLIREAEGTVSVVTVSLDEEEEEEEEEQQEPQEEKPEEEPAAEEEDASVNKYEEEPVPEQAPERTFSEDNPADVTVDSSSEKKKGGSWLESLWSICF